MTDETTGFALLASVLADPKKYAERLQILQSAKDAADEATAKAKTDVQAAEARLEELRTQHSQLVAELTAAKGNHDAAGAEAAARINTANAQAAELMKLQSTLTMKENELASREAAVLAETHRINTLKDELDTREELVRKGEANIAARIAKIKEAAA